MCCKGACGLTRIQYLAECNIRHNIKGKKSFLTQGRGKKEVCFGHSKCHVTLISPPTQPWVFQRMGNQRGKKVAQTYAKLKGFHWESRSQSSFWLSKKEGWVETSKHLNPCSQLLIQVLQLLSLKPDGEHTTEHGISPRVQEYNPTVTYYFPQFSGPEFLWVSLRKQNRRK